MNKRKIVSGILVAVIFIAVFFIRESLFNNASDDRTDVMTTEELMNQTEGLTEDKVEKTYSFRNDKYLSQHFEKHGEEFSYATKEEYVEGANRVINSKEALHKYEKEDGDEVYYIESTNEFVIVSTDGYIRTYFKPSDGINYYNRQ